MHIPSVQVLRIIAFTDRACLEISTHACFFFFVITAVYASAVVIDSVKKAQQQNSEELLIRVKEICRNKRVSYIVILITHKVRCEVRNYICRLSHIP